MSQRHISQRTPEYDTRLNTADEIERGLQRDNHRTWGLVIYRCTYKSDADWSEFMIRLRYQIQSALECYNGLDMLESLDMTVFEDRVSLDGAGKSAVREQFEKWTATAPEAEQSTGAGESQRYRYCIHVDAEALESVVYHARAPPQREAGGPGFVNLVSRYWEPDTSDLMEKEAEPVEGSELQDVGWMKVGYQCVMVGFYVLLRDWDDWYREYRRPPEIASS
ncbi:hypothetical protein MMC16_000173 [Acarospora aff. strigata]|nr:hypothetical protein [Acarospora aff. strigata]